MVPPILGRTTNQLRGTPRGVRLCPSWHVVWLWTATSVPLNIAEGSGCATKAEFARRLFTRALVQYDSSRRRILTDLPLSYEVNPGTIAYVGHGGLYHQPFDDGDAAPGTERTFRATDRGLLVKLSYWVRF